MGLCRDVSSADNVGVARVIAGDTSKHLSLAVAPIVLTTYWACSGGAPRIDSKRQNTVFRRQTLDPLPHPPICPRGGGFAKILASGLGPPSFESIQVLIADGAKAMPRQLLDGPIDILVAGNPRPSLTFASRAAPANLRRDVPPISADQLSLAGRNELRYANVDADHIAVVTSLRLRKLDPHDNAFFRQRAALNNARARHCQPFVEHTGLSGRDDDALSRTQRREPDHQIETSQSGLYGHAMANQCHALEPWALRLDAGRPGGSARRRDN